MTLLSLYSNLSDVSVTSCLFFIIVFTEGAGDI